MMRWIYLDVERIIEYNALALEKLKVKKADRPEVMSRQKLVSAVDVCKSVNGSVYDKAAAFLIALIQAHAFASGNRRTAFLATKDFLLENNGKLAVQDDAKDARVLQGIREGFYSRDDIKLWLSTGKIHEFKR